MNVACLSQLFSTLSFATVSHWTRNSDSTRLAGQGSFCRSLLIPASVSDFFLLYRWCQSKLGPHACTESTLLVEPCSHPQIHILNYHTLYPSASLIITAEVVPHLINNSSCFELKPFSCPSIHCRISDCKIFILSMNWPRFLNASLGALICDPGATMSKTSEPLPRSCCFTVANITSCSAMGFLFQRVLCRAEARPTQVLISSFADALRAARM